VTDGNLTGKDGKRHGKHGEYHGNIGTVMGIYGNIWEYCRIVLATADFTKHFRYNGDIANTMGR
jgi:hypothetical protein